MKFTLQRANTVLIAIAVTSNLAACKGEVLDYRNAQMVNGKVYASGVNEPFSGKLTNVPTAVILGPQQGFRTAIRTMEKTLPALTLDYISAAGIDYFPTDARIPSAAYCEAQVSNGYPDGKAICKAANSDHTLITMSFTSGQLDGELDSYAPDDSSHLFAKVAFRNGNADGRMEVYSPTTHRLVHTLTWANGVLNGEEDGFDETTSNRVLHATLVNGLYDGEFVRYAPDGTQVTYRAKFVNGRPDGIEEAYDPHTGRLTGHAEYASGVLNGIVKRWDTDGRLVYEKEYQNGQPLRNEAVAVCVNQRDLQHQSQEGEDISALLNEWEAQCREELHGAFSTAPGTAAASSATAGSGSTDAEITRAIRAAANEAVSAPAGRSTPVDACVDQWTAAFHRESGDDAIITADQLGEWQSWCKEGKRLK
ncbi:MULTISPECIES: toxin-antitoxin system YwqK family antitoxin [Burkholderia]|uniref:toxin-antitoxin system YwqK family antitoxin n=1 Tax=Burkholderia TaxID=32008 RepID=UPI00141E4319|nr:MULTISPECIES: toxin-antitoxin system YwqK family antitoxin [Burkholderia]NIE82548.1 toxin-antitoxin system YwqK family antitoxin [Burkholderia sp. Tr-860]NIF61325.1 toxin-antitoxin system YwqK family antitoxin [Burkholderia sp. Cy-647]NIF94530.1 toxin-antitoxin system YwqK family antitoxin [Burkholderia sp. Ax-1720]